MKKSIWYGMAAVVGGMVVVRALAALPGCLCQEASTTSVYAACTKTCTTTEWSGATNCTFTTSGDWPVQCNARFDAGEWKCVADGTVYTSMNRFTGTCTQNPEPDNHWVCQSSSPPETIPMDWRTKYKTVSCYGGS